MRFGELYSVTLDFGTVINVVINAGRSLLSFGTPVANQSCHLIYKTFPKCKLQQL